MADLKFELQKNGFPITIGSVEFFFETSSEKIKEFFDRLEKYDLESEKLRAELAELDGAPDLDEEDATKWLSKAKEEAVTALDLTKRVATISYDSLLGEGSFNKIYDTFDDVTKLFEIFPIIEDAVADAIIDNAEVRNDTLNKKRAEILKKKAAKRKKAKK